MDYILKFNGEKVKSFTDPLKAKAFANRHCKGGEIEIVSLTETSLPKASKMRHNLIANYGVYKLNPYTLQN